MIQLTDITAWCGDAQLTAEQLAIFAPLVQRHEDDVISRRPHYGTQDYHPSDYATEDAAAWVAAYEIATGTFDLGQRGRDYREAQEAAEQGAVMAVLARTATEEQAAAHSTVSRGTIRKRLGK